MSRRNSKKSLSSQQVVGFSLLVSLSDVSLNVIVGLITGSRVMFAQALQGLSDLTTAFILYTGVRRSMRHADKKHPLGYGREIFFWVLIAGVMMFIGTGLVTLYLGLRQVINPGELENIWLAFAMLTFGATTNWLAFQKSVNRLRGTHKKPLLQVFRESSLVETKATFIVDFLGTASALLGLIALGLYVLTGSVVFDGLGGMAVGLSMMLAAMVLVLDVRDMIIGKAVPEKVTREIRRVVRSHKEIEEILDLRTLYLGSEKLLILLEVHVDDTLSTNQIEKLLDKIRVSINRSIPHAYHLQIEVETPDNELPA